MSISFYLWLLLMTKYIILINLHCYMGSQLELLVEEVQFLLEDSLTEVEVMFLLEMGLHLLVDQLAIAEVGLEVGGAGVGRKVRAALVDEFEEHGEVANLVGLDEVLLLLGVEVLDEGQQVGVPVVIHNRIIYILMIAPLFRCYSPR